LSGRLIEENNIGKVSMAKKFLRVRVTIVVMQKQQFSLHY
jgi:hypothetical protein